MIWVGSNGVYRMECRIASALDNVNLHVIQLMTCDECSLQSLKCKILACGFSVLWHTTYQFLCHANA